MRRVLVHTGKQQRDPTCIEFHDITRKQRRLALHTLVHLPRFRSLLRCFPLFLFAPANFGAEWGQAGRCTYRRPRPSTPTPHLFFSLPSPSPVKATLLDRVTKEPVAHIRRKLTHAIGQLAGVSASTSEASKYCTHTRGGISGGVTRPPFVAGVQNVTEPAPWFGKAVSQCVEWRLRHPPHAC